MKKMTFVMAALLLLAAMSACNFPFADTSEDDLATSVAETVEALESEYQQPALPLVLASTSTPYPTSTFMPTMTVAATDEPEPCLYAAMVSETIADNTVFSPGEDFTKSWTLQNTGACTWNTDFKLSFKSGDQMSAPDSVNISSETDPGDTVKIEVDMTAPSDEDTYKGYWQMVSNKGVKFGQVWVQIKVE